MYIYGSSTNNTFDNNLFYGNHPASEPSDANKITSDPLFVSPGSGGLGLDSVDGYMLYADSPAIDAGITITGNGGIDYWANTVPYNGTPDIGAHEWSNDTNDSPPEPNDANETIFADGFEDCFTNWTTGGAYCSTMEVYAGSKSAKFDNTEYVIGSISTSGYTNITVKYAVHTTGMAAGDSFTSEWSDGTSWNNLETISSGFTGWTTREFNITDANAEDNANFELRFKVDNVTTDFAYVDVVEVTGIGEGSDGNDVANGETAVSGTVTGDYIDTQATDDTYESIQERESGGNPNNRYSYLEHKWTIDVLGGDTVTFYVEAYHTSNSENDDFVFAYSTDDSSYTNMVTVTKTSDDDTYQSYALPGSTSGTVYIRVLDTDQTAGNKTKDTIYVDHMYIQSAGAGEPDTTPPTPDAMTWSSTPAATGSTSIEMTATTATDSSGVEYYFECTAGGGNDSNWQDETYYEDTGLTPDTPYSYRVKARDKSANQNETAYSSTLQAYTDASCTQSTIHVESIVCEDVAGSQGNKYGRATVTIYDNCGNPVQNADVDGTFTGDFDESFTNVTTNGSGVAVFDTTTQVKKPSFTFCVDDVTHATLTYDDNDNVETCDTN